MLTNVFEGGREKCGRYWESNDEWDVLVDDDPSFKMNSGEPESSRAGSEGGGFFDSAPTNPPTQTIVRRTLHIRRRSDPVHIPRRKIRHLQYIAWPDFDVPANPSDVVKLIREVEVAQKLYLEETNGETKRNETRREAAPPVVCMCSAGIGRTGVFILVSTLLDKLKRDRIARSTAGIKRKKSSTKRYRSLPGTIEDSMDLDRAVSSPRLETPSSLAATLLASTLDSPFTQTTTTPTFSPNLPEPLNSDTAPLLRNEPIFATLNELREQRMSMVGNYRQYVCAVECILVGALEELELERKESASYFA
jgi:protein tyrosine phosphatase